MIVASLDRTIIGTLSRIKLMDRYALEADTKLAIIGDAMGTARRMRGRDPEAEQQGRSSLDNMARHQKIKPVALVTRESDRGQRHIIDANRDALRGSNATHMRAKAQADQTVSLAFGNPNRQLAAMTIDPAPPILRA